MPFEMCLRAWSGLPALRRAFVHSRWQKRNNIPTFQYQSRAQSTSYKLPGATNPENRSVRDDDKATARGGGP